VPSPSVLGSGGRTIREETMLRRVLAVVCGVGVIGVVALVPAKAAHADEGADSCVGFEKSDDDKAIVYDAKNSCDQKLSCELRWRVQCEDADGNVTASVKKSARFSLSESGTHTLSLSAETCKQSWRIDDVAWKCTPSGVTKRVSESK
jgi:hypothetical protein